MRGRARCPAHDTTYYNRVSPMCVETIVNDYNCRRTVSLRPMTGGGSDAQKTERSVFAPSTRFLNV